ncbi:neutral alpha-glucosidase AB-like isoform X2 [Gigantopelta aegis]|uniref:neutral alpha-glucosidase AB-like isoform X2 n=1 Tax=Gigantopelta aegis TaxID=1735272 RepID=UPI001B88DE40|nr:neutral alpha-glucosidase AB-like isoform X2 [Gigantopelta aegis]
MSFVHVCICISVLVSQSLSVNKDNFKSCDQSGFCKRQRNYEPGESTYIALLNSLKTTSTSIELQLLNKKNSVKLLLQVIGLQDNTIRVKINELSPLKLRYEIPYGEVITKQPVQQEIKVDGSSQKGVTFTVGDTTGVISAEPFRMDIFSSNEPVISLNARNLLKFEHMRVKPGWFSSIGSGLKSWFSQPFRETPQPDPPNDDHEAESDHKEGENEEGKEENEENKEDEPKDEPNMWEETYKTFTDSKPNGPTSVGMDISFPGFQFVYGIPQHADSLALKTTKNSDPYRLFNLDVFEYDIYSPMALYGSVPMMIAHNEKKTVAVFWHNAAETWVDISSNVADKVADFVQGNNEIPQTDTHWFSESGIIDLFIMMGPRPKDVFRQYALITGTTALPPLFSIAYHQCRWNYNDEADVAAVEENMDKADIPFDVMWLDIEHTDGKRYFTWANDKFPNPKDMIGKLSSKGRKMVIIVDPHLKKDDSYDVYTDAKSKGYFVKNKDGSDYEGWCWPGTSAWPDFINPDVQQWWASKFVYDTQPGSTPDLFVWNDMNEPSVFNGPEVTFLKDLIHHGGVENRDVHNIYGLYVQKATADGLVLRSGGRDRPFVLTRAFFAGSQKYGAVWTGDNMGEWSHLKISIPMILSLNIAGITFSGADIGGFFKNPDAELQTRWYQAGSFYPFFRAHAHLDTKRREPYLLPEENMKIVRDAIRARYSLLPYLYTQFYLAEKDGRPIMQPLWVEFPEETATFGIDDNFLLGPALLVRPVTEQGATTANVYFPGSDQIWYDVQTYAQFSGGQEKNIDAPLNKIPVYQRGGTIIPRKMRIRRSATLSYQDPFTLIVCLDKQAKALGHLYADDYRSFQYKNREYIHRGLIFENNQLESKNFDRNSKYTTKEWIEKIVIAGFKKTPNKIFLKKSDGSTIELGHSFNSENKVLTIRKPDVNISEDWRITIN